jgi:hypothetical protein
MRRVCAVEPASAALAATPLEMDELDRPFNRPARNWKVQNEGPNFSLFFLASSGQNQVGDLF